MTYLWISLFGLVGVSLRYSADLLVRVSYFPWATLLVNVVGCFIAGFVFQRPNLSEGIRGPLLIGLCGGLTTFSALILQTLQLFKAGDFTRGISYFFVSAIMGLIAAWFGMKIA
jgi:CrcB protein